MIHARADQHIAEHRRGWLAGDNEIPVGWPLVLFLAANATQVGSPIGVRHSLPVMETDQASWVSL